MENPSCRICGTYESLLRCAKCKTVYYCSVSHQHMDWPIHKTECRNLTKQKNSHKNQSGSTNSKGLWLHSASYVSTASNGLDDGGSDFSETGILTAAYPLSLILSTKKNKISVQAETVSQNQHTTINLQTSPNHSHSQHARHQKTENSSSYQIGHGDENYILQTNSSGNANERRYEDLCKNIINDMNTYGLSVVDDFLGMEKGLQILNEVHRMYAAGVFKDGQLVSNEISERDLRTIRGDKITWIKGVEPGCSNVGYLINQIDAVICRANTMKNNGKLGNYSIRERTKAMVACYPGSGSHYVMHVDNPNRDGRVITAIYYLNVNWDTKRSGGVLRIFPEHGGSIADIEPKFDRLIFFWSDKRNPHEVQPAHRTRYAITVWYFDANEREAALERCRQFRNSNSNSSDICT